MTDGDLKHSDTICNLHRRLCEIIESSSVTKLEVELRKTSPRDIKQAVQLRSGERNETILHKIASTKNPLQHMECLLGFLQQQESQRGELLSMLMRANADDDTVLHYAARNNQTKLVKTIIHSLPFDQQRFKLIICHNSVRILDECPPDSEGSETALHLASEDTLRVCVESVCSEKMRMIMLLEVDERKEPVIHHCYDSTYILNEAITKPEHKLQLLLAKNLQGRNCLHEAMTFGHYDSVSTMIGSLSQPSYPDSYLSQLILDRDLLHNHTGAFMIRDEKSEEDWAYIQHLMDRLSLPDKIKFSSHGGNKSDKTVFHHIVKNHYSCSTHLYTHLYTHLLKRFLRVFPYDAMLSLIKLKTAKGLTILHIAAMKGDKETIKLIHEILWPSDWKALLYILVLDNEAGGITVRNKLLKHLSDQTYHRYLDNKREARSRARDAVSDKLDPAIDSTHGDSALTYCMICDHGQTFSYLLESLDDDDAVKLLRIKDVFGLEIFAEDYNERTLQCITEVRYDWDYFSEHN